MYSVGIDLTDTKKCFLYGKHFVLGQLYIKRKFRMDSSIKTTNGYTSVENNKKNMSLIINGTETTLKEQISKKIAANQANGLSYNLHQDILVISHSGKSTCVCGEIENQLNSSTVKWNKLIINGEKSVIKEPEIFQKTGIAKIIKAARSAEFSDPIFKKCNMVRFIACNIYSFDLVVISWTFRV